MTARMDCHGARALVTGAGRRVGRAIALELARAGCDVAVHYSTSAPEAEQTAADIAALGRRAVVICGDLTRQETPGEVIGEACTALGGLDILVNNAAIFEADPAGGFDPRHWERTFRINAFAPAALIERAAEVFDRGTIINLCDIAADRPWRGYSAYCASKAALVNLTRGYARKLAPRVQVNGVSPGIAVFPEDYSAELRAKLIARVPLKRAGTPQDVALAVRFLVEHGDYITGHILPVDGGRGIV